MDTFKSILFKLGPSESWAGIKRKAGDHFTTKKVHFADNLEQLHEYELHQQDTEEGNEDAVDSSTEQNTSVRRTSQFTVLSSLHGRARRHLREIDIFDLQTAVKYGVKSPGHPCPKTRSPRWKYVYGNLVYITDMTSTKEVTSYKEAIKIAPAPISAEMIEQHQRDVLTLERDPYLCATHSVIVIDQSGSMKTCDVKGFKTRSQAAYGVLALEYIAEQIQERGVEKVLDTVSIIEMNDIGSVIFHREPLDWILFNSILDRQIQAKPRSHGNYFQSLEAARWVISREINGSDVDIEDLPSYAIIFLSDGKPSDRDPNFLEMQQEIVAGLANELKENFSFHAIGLGQSDADFNVLQQLAAKAEEHGSTGTFQYSALSGAQLTGVFSSVVTSVTASRTSKFSCDGLKAPREEKKIQLRSKSVPKSERKFNRHVPAMSRWAYDHKKFQMRGNTWPWADKGFRHAAAIGFDMEKVPFGKGAERLAYMFYEVTEQRRRVGKSMVAKETKFVDDEERKVQFHETFCRVQRKSNEFAVEFNRVIKKTPTLTPIDSSLKTPDIRFLDCHVYAYTQDDGIVCGLLVEDFLKGRFTKYNGNNGYVKKKAQHEPQFELGVGEVCMSDFPQAFSHWVYVQTDHELIVCDLQGVLNEEGRHPRFELTDPCINCKGKRSGRKLYGSTNMGLKGLRAFHKHHTCNNVCKGLGLPKI